MQLILWRHADAEDAGAGGDHARELTRRGHAQAARMAAWLRPRLDGEWRILCSPAVRAVQTVTPLDLDYTLSAAIGTGSNPGALLRETAWPAGRNMLVVGHQPTLGEVVARLLGGSDGDVEVRKGSIWWFETRQGGGGAETVLKTVLDPEMLESQPKGAE